ncbi:TetR/AcrR family transcriptional regulator [Pseudonocardia humida]|uniref:TetR family transcriptional regulator n=1 Tax=Pseudonocardia humida TaxID=2800819 RepID=A0ABT0ZZ54_9PSEU|nr:TetR/AcrR family transcriptional regulator [Pseudonocardia humida]MCO1656022.1 TetR family transcriptional regulator [Pseudonocardia humida]
MTDRRSEILDGALRVLAEQGMRGLTHRAVDGAAGLSQGSTSYYFRSRAALVAGCVDRLLELDLQIEVAATPPPANPAELVEQLVAAGISMATGQRFRTMARYELSLAAAREPELRAALVRGGDAIRAVVAQAVRAAGVTAPDERAVADELAATLDGMVFAALVRGPHEAAGLAAWLRPALTHVLSAHLGAR